MAPPVGGFPDSILSVLKVTPGPHLAEVGGTRSQALTGSEATQSLYPVSDRVIRGLSPAEVGETQGPVTALSETSARWFLLGSTRTLQGTVSPGKLRGLEGSFRTQVSTLQAAGCASAACPWLTCSLRRIRYNRRLHMTSDAVNSVPGRKRTCPGTLCWWWRVVKQGRPPLESWACRRVRSECETVV